MRFVVLTVSLFLGLALSAHAEETMSEFDNVLSGKERPSQIPDDWTGSPTKDAKGWRYDDPQNPANSVRFYAGDPNDPDPSKRQPYVIVVKDGQMIGRDGQPIEGLVPPP